MVTSRLLPFGSTTIRATLLALACVALAGCATHFAPDSGAAPYGFFSGLLHGVLLPFSLGGEILSWLLSLVGISVLDSVAIVGEPNTGTTYFIGFGFGVLSAGGSSGARPQG